MLPLFSFFCRMAFCSQSVLWICPSSLSEASHCLQGNTCSMPVVGQNTMICSRNHPAPTPLLSCPTSRLCTGLSSAWRLMLKISDRSLSKLPFSSQILPLDSLLGPPFIMIKTRAFVPAFFLSPVITVITYGTPAQNQKICRYILKYTDF